MSGKGTDLSENTSCQHLLYYRSSEEIRNYQDKPVAQRLGWLQMQMEFYHKSMPPKAKEIRERLFGHSLIKDTS